MTNIKRHFFDDLVINLSLFILFISMIFIIIIPMLRTKYIANRYKSLFLETIDSIEDNIDSITISATDKIKILNSLNELKNSTIEELKPASNTMRVIIVSKKLEELMTASEFLKTAPSKIEISQDEYIKLILAPIETKLNFLYEERLTKWDVVWINCLVLAALSALLSVIAFVINFLSKILPKKRIKKNQTSLFEAGRSRGDCP